MRNHCRFRGFGESDACACRRECQRNGGLKAARAALEFLDDHCGAESADEATKSARALYEAKVRRLQISSPTDEECDEAREMERYRALRLELLGVERSELLALRRDGRINATVLRTIERDLDLEEARLSGS